MEIKNLRKCHLTERYDFTKDYLDQRQIWAFHNKI